MITAAALWGGCLFVVGMANWLRPTYGVDFLQMIGSVWPGYHPAPTLGSALTGAVYGAVDGAIGGYLFAAIYDLIACRRPVGPIA
ncbi:MAG: hypothetical protein R2762_29735 [Bryobacteraceae bacterium]